MKALSLALSVLFLMGVVGCGGNASNQPSVSPQSSSPLVGDWQLISTTDPKINLSANSGLLFRIQLGSGQVFQDVPVTPGSASLSSVSASPEQTFTYAPASASSEYSITFSLPDGTEIGTDNYIFSPSSGGMSLTNSSSGFTYRFLTVTH